MNYTINGVEWNVVYVDPASVELMRSDYSRTVGMCDGNRNCIFLSNSLRGPFLRKVLIHEICHSAVFSYGINIDIQQEEFLCDFIATFGDEIFSVVDDIFQALKKVA